MRMSSAGENGTAQNRYFRAPPKMPKCCKRLFDVSQPARKKDQVGAAAPNSARYRRLICTYSMRMNSNENDRANSSKDPKNVRKTYACSLLISKSLKRLNVMGSCLM